MGAAPEVSTPRRRASVQRRHRLDGAAATAVEAARCVVALHATDPASVYLSVLARVATSTIDGVARTLYDDRALVRLMGMRRTLFVVPADDVALVQDGAAPTVARTMRRTLLKQLRTLPTDPPLPEDPAEVEAWLDETVARTEAEARRLGPASGAQLGAAEPRLRTALLPTTEKSYDVRRTVTTQVLTLMGAEGRLVRHRPLGSWTSRQHTWEPWDRAAPPAEEEAARVALLRAYLHAFGPVTETDVVWWTGWAKGVARRAVAALDVVETTAGLVLADDLDPLLAETDDPPPVAALLPSLDPTTMGWKERGWFLPPDPAPLYDAFGNVGPTLWWRGEVVGGWAVRPDGTLATRLLVDRGAACREAVAAAAAALEPRLEGSAVVPSFPVPLEKQLRTA